MPITDLHHAAMHGTAARIAELIAAGADTEARDERDRTPLHHAVWNPDAAPGREIINTLLELGADPTAADEDCMTPLHAAAPFNTPEPDSSSSPSM